MLARSLRSSFAIALAPTVRLLHLTHAASHVCVFLLHLGFTFYQTEQYVERAKHHKYRFIMPPVPDRGGGREGKKSLQKSKQAKFKQLKDANKGARPVEGTHIHTSRQTYRHTYTHARNTHTNETPTQAT